MNLLTDDWLPVRSLDSGTISWISLETLLTSEKEYEIFYPRDDLEMAALQLVICIAQVLFTPENMDELKEKIRKPMSNNLYFAGITPYKNWFELEHPKYPFMQVRGVKAQKKTPIHRLLPGLADATNSCFVNEAGIAESLCGGCSAIAIFNRASNSPSFGGGAQGAFKQGLRAGTPITTLVQGRHLREMVWLNVLSKNFLMEYMNLSPCLSSQKPTWVSNIKRNSLIEAHTIGIFRGLFWQPALIELGQSRKESTCNLCGREGVSIFDYFLKNQFGYTISGIWPHPHSPLYFELKKGKIEKRFGSFKTNAPSWTELARFVVKQSLDSISKQGQTPAAVIMQAQKLFNRKQERITLAIGGYRNEPGKIASIVERRHESISLNRGWVNNPRFITEIVQIGLGYKSALTSALNIFDRGKIDKKSKRRTIKGLGFSKKKNQFNRIAEAQFFRRTDGLMQKVLAEANFTEPKQLSIDKDNLRTMLKRYCMEIFEEQTAPYLNDSELIRTMAVAKLSLYKQLKSLEPKTEEQNNE